MRYKSYIGQLLLLLGLTACSPKLQTSFMQTNQVQLSDPVIHVQDLFFYDSTSVRIGTPYAGSQVYYSKENGEISIDNEVAGEQIKVKASSQLRFRSIGEDFISSDIVKVKVFKILRNKASMLAAPPAKAPYDDPPPSILLDHQKASKDFRGKDWLGYQEQQLVFEIEPGGGLVHGLALSTLEDQNSWIFSPTMITATFYDEAGEQLAMARAKHSADIQKEGSSFRFMEIEIEALMPARIRLEVSTLEMIPEWHPGSGYQPWLFIDEIVIF